MNIELFYRRLEELVKECNEGHGLDAPIAVEMLMSPEREDFFGLPPGEVVPDCFKAYRMTQPIQLRFTLKARQVSNWQHVSGDNRRLHHSLRPNKEPTATVCPTLPTPIN